MKEQPSSLRNLTAEQKRRQAAGNTPAKGRKGRVASPWDRGPMCAGPNATRKYQEIRKP